MKKAYYFRQSLPPNGTGCAKALTNASKSQWGKPIVIIALKTAMRRDEILSLRWEDIDLTKRFEHLPMTRTGSSRDVPLSLRAVQTLQSLPTSIDGRVFPIALNALK